ncbi:MAG: hypothetical protein EKK48_13030 [Candidatus Melainabacteria bacterium]|nr:MAG: hypothetical protein EKK48_13030 [Candidatus Melainabacteria bacterium]
MELLGSVMISVVMLIGGMAGLKLEARYLRPRNLSLKKLECIAYLTLPALAMVIVSYCLALNGYDAIAYVILVAAGLLFGVSVVLA